MKRNLHIEVVRSTLKSLSSLSEPSAEAIVRRLRKHYQDVGVSIVNDLDGLKALVAKQPDLVFTGMKYVPTGDPLDSASFIWLADYLEAHHIAYTGSDKIAYELELNKHLAKRQVARSGLQTSPFYVINQGEVILEDAQLLTYPVFIKPTNRGGGSGIDSASLARDFPALQAKVHYLATNLQSDSLIEEYLPGREFSVAILKALDSNSYATMPLELIAPADERGSRILSAKIKHEDTEQFVTVTDPKLRTAICRLALASFHALGAQDYGRVDIRLDSQGLPHFLEANLIPSLLDGYGNFPKACMINASMDYETMLLHIVSLGLARRSTDHLSLPVDHEHFFAVPVVLETA